MQRIPEECGTRQKPVIRPNVNCFFSSYSLVLSPSHSLAPSKQHERIFRFFIAAIDISCHSLLCTPSEWNEHATWTFNAQWPSKKKPEIFMCWLSWKCELQRKKKHTERETHTEEEKKYICCWPLVIFIKWVLIATLVGIKRGWFQRVVIQNTKVSPSVIRVNLLCPNFLRKAKSEMLVKRVGKKSEPNKL